MMESSYIRTIGTAIKIMLKGSCPGASTIQIANMSLSGLVGPGADDNNYCGNTNDDALHRAICNSVAAGVTYVVAAGNSSGDASQEVPAAYDEVITVSALADYDGRPFEGAANTCNRDPQIDDDFAFFSNFGPDVDIGAPGVCIRSTWKGSGRHPNGTYNTISGTSMASPHVAGAATLYKSTHPSAFPGQGVHDRASQHRGQGEWSHRYV